MRVCMPECLLASLNACMPECLHECRLVDIAGYLAGWLYSSCVFRWPVCLSASMLACVPGCRLVFLKPGSR
eukprot:10415748-Alexandrium_andersonii.AAC.1